MGTKMVQGTKEMYSFRGRMIYVPQTYSTLCFSDSCQDILVSLLMVVIVGHCWYGDRCWCGATPQHIPSDLHIPKEVMMCPPMSCYHDF